MAPGLHPSKDTMWVFPCLKPVGTGAGNKVSVQGILWRTGDLVGAGIAGQRKAHPVVFQKASTRLGVLVLYVSWSLVNNDF